MTRISPPDTPFKGLVPYDEEDAQIGRASCRERV
jgi:hypothetical protein